MKKFAGFLFWVLSSVSFAQDVSRLHLKTYLDEVRVANPEIAASAALSRVYSEKAKQAWQPMEPVVEFERMYATGALGSGAAERNILIRQEFRNPYKSSLQKKAASAESSYYSGLNGDRTNKVLAEAKSAFYEYALHWQHERIYTENLELLKKFSRIAETRYAVNQGAQGDAIKAQVELSKGLNMLITVQQDKETAAARMNALRNRPPDTPLAEPEQFNVNPATAGYKALESAALIHNPYLAAMSARVKAAEKKLSLARAEYAPDFMLSWRRRSADNPDMNRTYDVSLGLTLPLWFTKQTAMGREARAELDMNAAEYDSAKNSLLLELKEASVKLDYYARLIELYGTTILPQAEQSLKAAESGYQAGKTDFLDLVDSNRTLLEAKREYYESSAGYAAWSARLESLTGMEQGNTIRNQ